MSSMRGEGGVNSLCRPIFISTYEPTTCGIATFTQDLADAVDRAAGEPVSRVVAIRPNGPALEAGDRVVFEIDKSDRASYAEAAEFCNSHSCTHVCLQHEYGLFAGHRGNAVLSLVRGIEKPLFTTLHTVKKKPGGEARDIVRELGTRSECLVAMSPMAPGMLAEHYGLSTEQVKCIPHGVHDVTFSGAEIRQKRASIHGAPILLTMGLLRPDKGIEHAIDALPDILEQFPNAVYVIAGQTHPARVRREGEQYRRKLKQRARDLGVRERVQFVNRYLSLREFLLFMSAADVYVSPHLGREQITSGTLAYAVAAGTPVVSTPYPHAQDMWRAGAVVLTGFEDSTTLAEKVLLVLKKPPLREHIEKASMRLRKNMLWNRVGQRYYDLFASVTSPAARCSGAAEGGS